MAQRTHVLLIDDLDGSTAEETVAFGLDGSIYEVDLSAENAEQLRESLASYIANGRKAAIATANGRRRSNGSPARHLAAPDTTVVRAWARSSGYAVNDRGRIAADLLEAYRAAH